MTEYTDMEETPAYMPVVSLHLSRILDEIGLNVLTVKRRRSTFLYAEKMRNIFHHLNGEWHFSIFHFGSQAEGTTTPGLDSDLDTLNCHQDFGVIESWAQWQHNRLNLLMLQEDTAPGYCRLQPLRSDVPMAREDLPYDGFTYDSTGRVILLNTSFFRPDPNYSNVRNGPARSEDGGFICLDRDFVEALRCRSWPDQAGEFIRRRRRHDWPSPRLVQQAIKHGVFIVPVGHKRSPTEHLEWRISPSMAERCLMFSLGMVHIKCYVVLKMLIKTFVQPFVGKCISSYHCKTALLYCTENTEPVFWREDNLLQCVTRCLVTLLTWVKDCVCPNFMISEENMFAGKVTAQNKDVLQSVLTDLIKSNGRALLSVKLDSINSLLQSKLSTESTLCTVVPVLDSEETMKLIGGLECKRLETLLQEFTWDLLKDSCNAAPLLAIRALFGEIKTLKADIGRYGKIERQAIQTVTAFLSGKLGSMMASFSLSQKRPLPRKALQLLRSAAKGSIAFALKLASVLYSNGDLRQVEMMLHRVNCHFFQPICACYAQRTKGSLLFCRLMYSLKGSKARFAYLAHCVTFSAQEIHCAPPALWNELHRSAGDDIQRRDANRDTWMRMGAVDCLPFLFYLQYLTYKQLGKQKQRQLSLHNLGTVVRYDMCLGHLETAWNLLGQCMEMEDDHNAALQCYITSLEVRPRNNAANWHVATLCYTQLQKRGLLK